MLIVQNLLDKKNANHTHKPTRFDFENLLRYLLFLSKHKQQKKKKS